MRIQDATHGYVARRSCGCVAMMCVDLQDRTTAKDVAQAIRDGYTVERVPLSAAPPLGMCPHKKRQERLL